MENRAKVMILADEDFVGGARKGYYKEYENQIENGNLCFVTMDEASVLRNNGELLEINKSDGEIFLLNPYNQVYYPIDYANIEEVFRQAKAIAVKDALISMGAHCVILSEELKDYQQRETDVNLGVKTLTEAGPAGGKGGVNVEKEAKINMSTTLRYLNEQNTPKDKSQIEDILREKGLLCDIILNSYFKRICNEGVLHGTENMAIHFLSELKSAVDVAIGLNYGPIDADLSVSHKNYHVHEQTKDIMIYFDDVPDKVKEIINTVSLR